jgi:hypothetical protein
MTNQSVVIGVVVGIAVIVLLGLSVIIPFPDTLLSITGEARPMTNEELIDLFWDEEVTFAEFLSQLRRTHPVAAGFLKESLEEWAATFGYSPEEFKVKFRDLAIWPSLGDSRILLTLAEYRDQFVKNFPVAAAFLQEWALDFVDYAPEELESLRWLQSQLSHDPQAVKDAVLSRLWGTEVTFAEVLDQVARLDPLGAAHWKEAVAHFYDYPPEELEIRWEGRPEDGALGISIGPRRVSPEGE